MQHAPFRGAPQFKSAVSLSLRVCHSRRRQRMARQVGGQFLRLREADRQQLAAVLADLLNPVLHLAQVRPASNSGQVPQKDKHQRPAAEFGELDRRTVGALERAIWYDLASPHFFTSSHSTTESNTRTLFQFGLFSSMNFRCRSAT
jgi:hypothetical protein